MVRLNILTNLTTKNFAPISVISDIGKRLLAIIMKGKCGDSYGDFQMYGRFREGKAEARTRAELHA